MNELLFKAQKPTYIQQFTPHSDLAMKSLLLILVLTGFLTVRIQSFDFQYYSKPFPARFTNEVIANPLKFSQLLKLIRLRKRLMMFLLDSTRVRMENLDNLKYIEM